MGLNLGRQAIAPGTDVFSGQDSLTPVLRVWPPASGRIRSSTLLAGTFGGVWRRQAQCPPLTQGTPAALKDSAGAASSSSDSRCRMGVQVLGQIRQKPHAKPTHRAAGLVARLVLIKAPVRVARSLADIETPRLSASRVMQQNDIDRVARALPVGALHEVAGGADGALQGAASENRSAKCASSAVDPVAKRQGRPTRAAEGVTAGS